jgi:hypothetical protein
MNFLKMYVQCISKEIEKIRNDGERCFEIKSLDYHETFSHVIKMNVFMNHVCIGNGLFDFEIQIKFQ